MSILRNSVAAASLLSATGADGRAGAFAETIGGALAEGLPLQFRAQFGPCRRARHRRKRGDRQIRHAPRSVAPSTRAVSTTLAVAAPGGHLTTGAFGVQIEQKLFDGFQTKNNTLTAEARVRAAVESLRNTEQNILFNAASSYMDVIRDRQIAVLRERNLEFLEEQVRAARSRFEVGEGTRTDVAQAEASRSSAVAQLAAARAQAMASAGTYRQIIGEDPGQLSSPAPPKGCRKTSIAIATGDVEHPAIVATEHLVDAAAFRSRRRKAAAAAVLGHGKPAQQLPQHVTRASSSGRRRHLEFGQRRPVADRADLSGRPRRRAGAAVQGIARPGAHRGRRHARPGAQCRRCCMVAYEAARENVAANRDLVAAAQLALEGVIEERNVGQRTTLDVLNAQADVITAQVNLVSSERDVVVASYAILSAIGHLSAAGSAWPCRNTSPTSTICWSRTSGSA